MAQLGDRQPYGGPDTPLLLIGREPGADGSYGRPSAEGPLPRDPNDPALWLPGQGRANACGTTTLAYVLRYLLGPAAPSRAEIDRVVRRANIFTAPGLLVEYARGLGLTARTYHNASLPFVLELVDRGVPVIVLTDTTPLDLRDTANLHWVAVVGHDHDRDQLAIYNPHGFQEAVDRERFEAHWREARIFGLPAWQRLAIAVTRDAALLPDAPRADLSALGANLAAGGLANLVNYAVALRWRLERRGAVRAALVGIVGTLGAFVPLAQALGGALLLLAGSVASLLRRARAGRVG